MIALWKSGTSDRAALVSGAVQQLLVTAAQTQIPLGARAKASSEDEDF